MSGETLGRIPTTELAQKAYQYCLQDPQKCQEIGIVSESQVLDYVQTEINEQIPGKRLQWSDVSKLFDQFPKRPIAELHKIAVATVGLEEQFYFYTNNCDTSKPRPTDPARLLMCHYFADTWKTFFHTEMTSVGVGGLIPTPNSVGEDGDTTITTFPSGDTHVIRDAVSDTQESVEYVEYISEVPKKKVTGQKGVVGAPHCYTHVNAKEEYCALHIKAPNTKVDRHANDTLRGLLRHLGGTNPALAAKAKGLLKNPQIKSLAHDATIYRGKIAGYIRQHIIDYAKAHGIKLALEPAFEAEKKRRPDGSWEYLKPYKFAGVGNYGRILGFQLLEKKTMLVEYLMDQKFGLSAFASTVLDVYHDKVARDFQARLNKIPFGNYGLSPVEVTEFKKAFMQLIPDPKEMYSAEKTTEMAKDWFGTSQYLSSYHYTNNVNFFMIFLGQAVNTWFGNSREKTAAYLKFKAAEQKHGLFGSEVFFQSYAPKKLRTR